MPGGSIPKDEYEHYANYCKIIKQSQHHRLGCMIGTHRAKYLDELLVVYCSENGSFTMGEAHQQHPLAHRNNVAYSLSAVGFSYFS